MTEYGGTQSLQVSLGYTRRIFRLPVFQILRTLSYSISKDFHSLETLHESKRRRSLPTHVTKSAAGKSLADSNSIGYKIPASELPDRAAVADAATNPHQ
jgi:hypothetical protein